MQKVARARKKRSVAAKTARLQHSLRPKRDQPRDPNNERDKLFCERWLVHHDAKKAWAEAGFSPNAGDAPNRWQHKLRIFRQYIDRLQPKVEAIVVKRLAYERADILEAIAAVGFANPLDYVEQITVIDDKTGNIKQAWRLKPLATLTRDQAQALDSVHADNDGNITYSLPKAKTRLTALTTLGEQAANFKKGTVHNHLHLGDDVPLEKIQELKALFADALGPQVVRELLGFTEETVDNPV